VPPLQVSNIPSAKNRIVYQKEDIYTTFPSLFVLPDGKLGTSFDTRAARSHIDTSGGNLSLISGDNGKTWSKTSNPLIDRKWQTKDGRLVRAGADGWVYVDASQEDELKKQHKIIMKVRPGTIAYKGGAHFATSTDGGKSWQKEPITIPDDCEGLMGYQFGIVTSKGVRLVAVYGRRLNPDTPTGYSKGEVYLLRSDDDGKSWKCYPMYPDGIPNTGTALNETTIEEAADGTIVAMMRSAPDDPAGYLREATSKDGGLTWTKPVTTSISGFPAALLRLKDGRLLCAYGYRRYPMGIRAVLSRDNGKTWDTEHELIIRSDGLGRPMDLGYPKLCQLPDGSIFCIYYITTDGYQNTHIASTTFKLPEP
jgi:Neuraminidase (sialidase)